MNYDVIELFDTFNAKGCLYELLFGYFHDQLITPGYYDLINYKDDDKNNTSGTLVDNLFLNIQGVEDTLVPNAPNIDDIQEDNDDDTEDDDTDNGT